MKMMNKHVMDTREQIDNTMQILSSCGLVRIIRNIAVKEDRNYTILTWENHVPGRHNAGNSFATINQYNSIYETGAYHCILFDGSIIRCFFKFNKNILVQESLLYWPAPIVIPEEDVDELGIRDAMDLYLSTVNSKDKEFKMRTPIRLDFDPANVSELHPATHIHMQHADCRISVKRPICFNRFIKFIFRNFYPDFKFDVFDDLGILNYSGYTVFEKAVMSF